jgi:bifunctional UDP-N-acetylglucosamine pyrophosphorylase/glucosamine-1-phosphate N-acetyltransferase
VGYITQTKRLGTGHALKTALPVIPATSACILVMYGDDSAFYPPKLFKTVVATHLKHQATISVLTLRVKKPQGLGRIIRNSQGFIQAIIEEKVATSRERQITEINTGLYCFDPGFLNKYLRKIQKNPVSREYYLTDLVHLAVEAGIPVHAHIWPDHSIWHGVNTREELESARQKAILSLT